MQTETTTYRTTRNLSIMAVVLYPILFFATNFFIFRFSSGILRIGSEVTNPTEAIWNLLEEKKPKVLGVIKVAVIASGLLGWGIISFWSGERTKELLGRHPTRRTLFWGPLLVIILLYGLILIVGFKIFVDTNTAQFCYQKLAPTAPLLLALAPFVAHTIALGLGFIMSPKRQ